MRTPKMDENCEEGIGQNSRVGARYAVDATWGSGRWKIAARFAFLDRSCESSIVKA